MNIPSDVQEFRGWLNVAAPGSAFIYLIAEVGDLGKARDKRRPSDEMKAAMRLANAAAQAYLAGTVDLVQRRTGAEFEYIAVKRHTKAERSLSEHTAWSEVLTLSTERQVVEAESGAG